MLASDWLRADHVTAIMAPDWSEVCFQASPSSISDPNKSLDYMWERWFKGRQTFTLWEIELCRYSSQADLSGVTILSLLH